MKQQIHCRRVLLALCLLIGSLLLLACGPESSQRDNDTLIAQTEQVALDYQASGNLNSAQMQLNDVRVANPEQWLIYVTETALSKNASANVSNALVKLCIDLGLLTTPIEQFAAANGMLAQPPPDPRRFD